MADFGTLRGIPVVNIISGSNSIDEFDLYYGTIGDDYLKQGKNTQTQKKQWWIFKFAGAGI